MGRGHPLVEEVTKIVFLAFPQSPPNNFLTRLVCLRGGRLNHHWFFVRKTGWWIWDSRSLRFSLRLREVGSGGSSGALAGGEAAWFFRRLRKLQGVVLPDRADTRCFLGAIQGHRIQPQPGFGPLEKRSWILGRTSPPFGTCLLQF